MRRVHADDVLGEPQHSLAELALRHDRAQVAHSFAVLVGIRDGGQRVQAAVVLRQRFYVRPRLVVMVKFRHSLLITGRGSDHVKPAEDCAQDVEWREKDGCKPAATEVGARGRHGGGS
jgi:hypothetical protein